MKRLVFIVALPFALTTLLSCSDDDNGLKVQAHNNNEMMLIMHTMSAEMDAMQMTGDSDDDFATMMMMHHQGAINMGTKELEKGDVAELKTMAQTMIDMQKTEIQELRAFLESHTPESTATGQQWGMEAEAAMTKMKNDADLQVITGMQIMILRHS